MPAPTQHPQHLAIAGFGKAIVDVAIATAVTMAVIALRTAPSCRSETAS
jgi:hypothetical protein